MKLAPLDPELVYLVQSEEDRSALLALSAKHTARGVEWFDTVRDRGFRVEAVEREQPITLRTPRASFTFRPLTLELYREHVRHRVEGSPDFESDAAVQQYYRSL